MSAIRTADLRRALAEAPSTTQELADILGMTRRNAQVGLWVLWTQGHVRKDRKVPNPEFGRGRRNLKLFEITPRGLARLRSKR